MKILPFKIPRTEDVSFLVQNDDEPHLYDTLHQHPEIQITLILQGSGTLFIGDYIGEFNEGDVIIIGENVPHVFRNDKMYYEGLPELRARALSVFLDRKTFGERFFELPETQEVADFFVRAKKGLKIGGKAKEEISILLKNISDATGIDRLIKLLEILRVLSRSSDYVFLSNHIMDTDVQEADGKRLNDVIQFTLNQYHRPIGLEEVSAIANMSPSAFCRFFKQRTRKTYVNFLTEVRISKACNYLQEKDATIIQTSYKVGFNNLSHFNRKFKKITGYTPTSYRRKHHLIA
ncbi:AraC family transcriptional regulator [Fulvivirgaceae bacterium BMA12]|uniref:AraC family transcriptional regulator n=1 Tax=Agaribacillus aureus TaxID=3051825 RepID=A0ABT8L136_9BACT|nr:AraC family transcriptional regulator [Fulvivirgaceae bacterium BMA12]